MPPINCNLPCPAVGIAYSGYVPSLLKSYPNLIDFVEVPFELLQHDPKVFELASQIPFILHCASLSVGGTISCSEKTLSDVKQWLNATKSPWLGEHLAFIAAGNNENTLPNTPLYNVDYTVSPPMNEKVLERTVRNLEHYRKNLQSQVILENSPLYFSMPTSTLSQGEFFQELCARGDIGVLLDLSHLYISSQNMNFDPLAEIEKFPLEKVVEIHISGVDTKPGGYWDNHAEAAPDIIYQMLEHVLKFTTPRAVTLEYNWSLSFSTELLLDEIKKVRKVLGNAALADSLN